MKFSLLFAAKNECYLRKASYFLKILIYLAIESLTFLKRVSMAKNSSAGKAKRKSDRFSKRIKSAIEKRKAARKLARQKRKARKHVTWTYIQDSYAVVIAWLNGRFDISEHEYLFGVVSFDKVRILEILRAIVSAEFEKGQ